MNALPCLFVLCAIGVNAFREYRRDERALARLAHPTSGDAGNREVPGTSGLSAWAAGGSTSPVLVDGSDVPRHGRVGPATTKEDR